METIEKELCDLCEELFIKKMQSFKFKEREVYYFNCNINNYHWSLQVTFSHLPPHELHYNLAIHKIDDNSSRGDGGNYYLNHSYLRSPEVFVKDFDIFCTKLKLHRVNKQISESCKIEIYKDLIKKVKNKLRRFK